MEKQTEIQRVIENNRKAKLRKAHFDKLVEQSIVSMLPEPPLDGSVVTFKFKFSNSMEVKRRFNKQATLNNVFSYLGSLGRPVPYYYEETVICASKLNDMNVQSSLEDLKLDTNEAFHDTESDYVYEENSDPYILNYPTSVNQSSLMSP